MRVQFPGASVKAHGPSPKDCTRGESTGPQTSPGPSLLPGLAKGASFLPGHPTPDALVLACSKRPLEAFIPHRTP